MVRKLTNLLAYLDERMGAHSGRGPEYQFNCPACIDRIGTESRGRKLGINVQKRVGGCFRCGFAFGSFGQLFRYLNGGFVRMEELALLRDETTPPRTSVARAVREVFAPPEPLPDLKPRELPLPCLILADAEKKTLKAPSLRPGLEYLEDRGVPWEFVERFQIGYCTQGRYRNRLVFPVIQENAQVYFTTRLCDDPDDERIPKSLNEPNEEGFHQRGTCLLNYDNCLGVERIAVVEGPFDMMAFEHAVALLGKFASPEQVRLFAHLRAAGLQEVVIALDHMAGKEIDALYSALLPVVPEVTVLGLDQGDPWERRDELEMLLEGRGVPSTADRIRQRLGR